jgi:hypothetical protein
MQSMSEKDVECLASTGVNAPENQEHANANSQAEVEKRATLGQVSCTGPIVMVTARTVLAVVAQAIVAFIYVLRRDRNVAIPRATRLLELKLAVEQLEDRFC